MAGSRSASFFRRGRTSTVNVTMSAGRGLSVPPDLADLVEQPRGQRSGHDAQYGDARQHEPTSGDRVAVAATACPSNGWATTSAVTPTFMVLIPRQERRDLGKAFKHGSAEVRDGPTQIPLAQRGGQTSR